MIILPNQDLSLLRSRDPVNLECEHCHLPFMVDKHYVQAVLKTKTSKTRLRFCSRKCSYLAKKIGISSNCGNCGITIYRSPHEAKKSKSGKYFCSRSCAGIYSNTHKTKGIRRSMLERWLEENLTALFPLLEILYNDKREIGSELDIYIPSLSLAFEINGVHHKKPIYGKKKLVEVQANDDYKKQTCIDKRIKLVCLDTSLQRRFTTETSQAYLDQIISAIKTKEMVGPVGTSPTSAV